MLSRTDPWDESTRPTSGGSTAAEPTAVGRHLVQVHDHFRAELGQLRHVLEQVRDGLLEVGAARDALNRMTIKANTWVLGSVCQSFCLALTGHHGLEDESVFPYLGSRDTDLRAVLTRLGEEHVVIHDLVESVDAALVALAARPDELGPVQDAVGALADALLSHLAYEERELVGPLSRFGFYPGQV